MKRRENANQDLFEQQNQSVHGVHESKTLD